MLGFGWGLQISFTCFALFWEAMTFSTGSIKEVFITIEADFFEVALLCPRVAIWKEYSVCGRRESSTKCVAFGFFMVAIFLVVEFWLFW